MRVPIINARSHAHAAGNGKRRVQYAEQAVQLDPEQEEYQFHLQTVKAKLLVHEARSSAVSDAHSHGYVSRIEISMKQSRLDPLNLDALSAAGRLSYATLEPVR